MTAESQPDTLTLMRHLAGDDPLILMIDQHNDGAGWAQGYDAAKRRVNDPQDRSVTFAPLLRDGLIAVDVDEPEAEPFPLSQLIIWLTNRGHPSRLYRSGGKDRYHLIIAPRSRKAPEVLRRCQETHYNVILGGTRAAHLRMPGSPPKAGATIGPTLLHGDTLEDAVQALPVTAKTAGARKSTARKASASSRPRRGPVAPLDADILSLIHEAAGPHATGDQSQELWRAARACVAAGMDTMDFAALATDTAALGMRHVHSKRRRDPWTFAVTTYKLAVAHETERGGTRPCNPALDQALSRFLDQARTRLLAARRHQDLAALEALVQAAHRAGRVTGVGASARQICEAAGLPNARAASRALRRLVAAGIVRLSARYDPRSAAALGGRASNVWTLCLPDDESPESAAVGMASAGGGALERGCVIDDHVSPADPDQSPFVARALGGLGHASGAVYAAVARGAKTLTERTLAVHRISAGQTLSRGKERALGRTLQSLVEDGLVTVTRTGVRPRRKRPSAVARARGIPSTMKRLRERHRRERSAWLDFLQTRYGAAEPLDRDRWVAESEIHPAQRPSMPGRSSLQAVGRRRA